MVIRHLAIAGALVATFATWADAQQRAWLPGERILISTFDDVLALAWGRDRLYVAAEAGIAVLDGTGAARWLPPLAPIDGYPDVPASALAWDGVRDGLWLGTEDGRLFTLDFAFGAWVEVPFRASAPIIRIRPDPEEGVLWVGTPDGWYRVRDDGGIGRFVTRVDQLPIAVRREGEQNTALRAVEGTLGIDPRARNYPALAAVEGERSGLYYAGTSGGGVVRVDTNTLERVWLPFGTLSRGVGAVAVDGARLWFGGDGQGPRNGVATSPRDLSEWNRIEAGVEGAPGGFVARIQPTADAVWFAASDGLYRRRGALEWARVTSADGLPADQTTAVVPGADGSAWVGTLRGLARVSGDGRVTATHLVGARVLDLTASGDTLWIATDRGLFASVGDAPPAPAPGTAESPRLRSGPVVAVAAEGGRLAALTPDALFERDDDVWRGPIRDPALSGIGALYRLHIGRQGGLWIAGAEGVAALETGRPWRTWRVPDDLPAGPVRGIALDGDDLWVATPVGAVRIDRTR